MGFGAGRDFMGLGARMEDWDFGVSKSRWERERERVDGQESWGMKSLPNINHKLFKEHETSSSFNCMTRFSIKYSLRNS